MPERCQ